MIEIPHDALEPTTLIAMIESFVGREGTDYGLVELSLEEKVLQVQNQLNSGNVIIVYDEITESFTLVLADDFKRMSPMQGQSMDDCCT